MILMAQRMTTSTIPIVTDNGFDDNDGDDTTGNKDDVDGNGATIDNNDDDD